MRSCLLFALGILSCLMADAKLVLPQMFQSGMVLQREKPILIWGQADAGQNINVTFKKKVYSTTADSHGQWKVTLPQQKAGGPFTLKIEGGEGAADCCELTDVLIGDVWLCSGQSNIDVTIERVYPQYGQVIDDYSNNQIRMFRVQTDTDTHSPKSDIKPTPIKWLPVTKQNAWLFSAVGYFLGREMFEKTKVPQGIIVNSLGGTPIQAWLPADTLRQYYPLEYRRLQFYQDDKMVKDMQRANKQFSDRWQKLMDDCDLGLSNGYAQPSFDDSQWTRHDQAESLTGIIQYSGSYWTRQHINIDAKHAGQPARLLLGTLYDADYTFLNGKEVGRTYYQYPPRRYDIPSGLLREGDNVIAVRFITKGGAPHFIKEKPYKIIFADGTELPLAKEWRIHEGVKMPRIQEADLNIQNLPSVLYNAMLYPLAPYSLSGVVWYQGESNTANGDVYEQMLTHLIKGWRQLWQQPELPFVVVQLANFMEPSEKPQYSEWSDIREAQRLAVKHNNNTELAVAIDLGEKVDIHPLRKREVAQRVALGFERMLWNKRVMLSPEVTTVSTDGRNITLQLDQPLLNEGPLHEFEVAGTDGRFVNAEAKGEGNRIVITSPIEKPVHIRYAWKNNPDRANVYAKNGLPMSPFRRKL